VNSFPPDSKWRHDVLKAPDWFHFTLNHTFKAIESARPSADWVPLPVTIATSGLPSTMGEAMKVVPGSNIRKNPRNI
jgi:hypothetical protein